MVFARGAAFARVKGPESVTENLQPKVVNKDISADDGAGFRVDVSRLVSRDARAKLGDGQDPLHHTISGQVAAAAGQQQQGSRAAHTQGIHSAHTRRIQGIHRVDASLR